VQRLDENRSVEEVRLVFEHVMKDLNSWIKNNREIDLSDEGVEQPLVDAIGATRFASTVRAAVRRTGDWYNLDFYHHLGFGVRKLGVDQIGARVEEFKVIVGNLAGNADLAPAKEFLDGIVERVDVALDESYRRLQASGREAFKQTLAKDIEYWMRCEGRWGQGPGYRDAIRSYTDQEIENQRAALGELLRGLLSTEWRSIVGLMMTLLESKPSPASTEV
jgi:hypothetical protein